MSCYLDLSSARAATCRARCTSATGQLAVDHVASAVLARIPADDAAAEDWLESAAPASPHPLDPRIAETLARISADPADAAPSRQLAAEVGLSESRFLHLFRSQVGTSLRRYRLWMRLISAGVAVSSGKTLTDAAADAGFASPSHLADRFKSTFGLTATQLLGGGAVLRPPTGQRA